MTFRDTYLERSRPKIFQISSWIPRGALAVRLCGRWSSSGSDSEPSLVGGGDRGRLFDGGAFEPKVLFLVCDEGRRGCLLPTEAVLGAVLGVDLNEEKDGVLERGGWGDDDFLVVDDVPLGC